MMTQEQQDRIRALMGTPEQFLIVGHVRGDDERHYLSFWTGSFDGTFRLYVQASTSAGTGTEIIMTVETNELSDNIDEKLKTLPLNRWQILQLFHCETGYTRFDGSDVQQLMHTLQREHTPLQGQPARMVINKYDQAFRSLEHAKAVKKRESWLNKNQRLRPFEVEVNAFRDELLRRLGEAN